MHFQFFVFFPLNNFLREISDNVATNLRELTSKDYSEMSVGEGMVIGFGGLAVLCCCGVCLYCLQLSRKKSPGEANKRGEANKKGVPTQDLIDLHNNNTIEGGLEVEKKPEGGQGSVDLLDLDAFGGVGAEMVSQETGEDRKDEGLEGLGGNEGAGESPAAFFSSTQTGRRQLLVGETSEVSNALHLNRKERKVLYFLF